MGPRCNEKTKGMTGIKVDKSSMGDNRCFWILRGDESEDFSANKCLNALEQDPPYAPDTAANAGAKKDGDKAATSSKDEAKKDENTDAAASTKDDDANKEAKKEENTDAATSTKDGEAKDGDANMDTSTKEEAK